MEFGLIGERLGHSFSKEVHERMGRYSYCLQELDPGELDGFLRNKGFRGINVTIPYKQAVIPYLDEISTRAQNVGAVNTVVKRGDKLFGDNTDFGGMERLIRRMGLDLQDKKVLILGTGGTSKTAYAVAEHLGANEIYKVSRSGADGAVTYEEAVAKHGDAKFLINTTPCGMYPKVEGQPIPLESFAQLEGVVDAIYNPLSTRLVQEARRRGIPAEGGLYMLIAQAVLAAEIFLDETLPETQIDEIYEEILQKKQNLVLIGMPASGKSTVGRILQRRLEKQLIDTDEQIVTRAGMEITEIFAQKGEGWFRDLESDIIKELSASNDRIISTGGGVPLRRENREALRQNGVVFFLDRPLEDLLPTEDRPLANDVNKIRRLYEERYPIYLEAADHRIPVEGTPEQVADAILERWMKKESTT